MTLLWLLFISLVIAGSAAYTTGMKLGTSNMSVFGFAVIMNIVVLSAQVLVCLVAKYGFKIDVAQGVNANTIKFAVLTGCGAAMCDVCYFLALRYGSVMASQIAWNVGAILVISMLAVFLWGEAFSPLKALGVAFGIASVILITKAS